MIASTNWGPILFGTMVPLVVVILGGIIHVVFRLGRLTEKVENVCESVDKLEKQEANRIRYRNTNERAKR